SPKARRGRSASIRPSSKPTWEPPTMPMLEVRGLTVRYGPLEAVRGIDFRVEAGQIVALVGSNGAGKSTTLKAVIGLVRAAEGAIELDGRDKIGRATCRERGEIARGAGTG